MTVRTDMTIMISLFIPSFCRLVDGVALELPRNLLTLSDLDKPPSSIEQRLLQTNNDVFVEQREEVTSQHAAASDWRRALAWRFPVLLTSLSPLRVYVHSEGVAWDGLTSMLQQKVGRTSVLLNYTIMYAIKY